MKKTVIYIILLVAAVMIPTETTQLGKIKPVEVVLIQENEGTVIIETDTGDRGVGQTALLALENLKESTPGVLYLDTADYLLVSETAERHIPEIAKYLKKGTKLCNVVGEIEISNVSEFLEVHKPECRLKRWNPDIKMEVLVVQNDRLTLE